MPAQEKDAGRKRKMRGVRAGAAHRHGLLWPGTAVAGRRSENAPGQAKSIPVVNHLVPPPTQPLFSGLFLAFG